MNNPKIDELKEAYKQLNYMYCQRGNCGDSSIFGSEEEFITTFQEQQRYINPCKPTVEDKEVQDANR